MKFKVGIGYDSHKLVDKDINQFPFLLGGIIIPFDKSCVAHSDGDVVIHAVCDALLGAAGLGDIGTLFPDTDPQFFKKDSQELLENVVTLISDKGFIINNIDITIILEKPKLFPYKQSIANNLARILKITTDSVSVKAKTNEGLDAVGKGEAVVVHSICLLITNQ
jgi:2-C-methyl-D-erythritol 2,4-cyclodiphosphate synthase